jgi:hypothetical protein
MKQKMIALFLVVMSLTAAATEDWKVYFQSADVVIEYRYADCHDEANGIHQQKVFLRFKNTSSQKVELSFQLIKKYSKSSTDGSSDESIQSIVIPANSTLSGDCSTKNKSLFVFVKQLNLAGTELKKFDLQNISIKPLEQ